MDANTERRNRKVVNSKLVILGQKYHDGLPIAVIDSILSESGFRPTEEGIYCGREGRSNEQVGEHTHLTLAWHKMEVSGRYEVTAYVS